MTYNKTFVFRPWYVQTFAPEPKDIVIVMDGTDKQDSQVLKDAILSIIGTTSPNDRVSCLTYNCGWSVSCILFISNVYSVIWLGAFH